MIANMLYRVVQILQAVAPDFLNIMCHVPKNHFMNNFGLSKCSEIRTCLTKECQKKRKSCEVRWRVETQSEVRLGGRHESHWTSIAAKGNLHCPLYSEKESLCGVETYLNGTGLKTKVFGVYCARLESPNIHQYELSLRRIETHRRCFLISHLQALIPAPY